MPLQAQLRALRAENSALKQKAFVLARKLSFKSHAEEAARALQEASLDGGEGGNERGMGRQRGRLSLAAVAACSSGILMSNVKPPPPVWLPLVWHLRLAALLWPCSNGSFLLCIHGRPCPCPGVTTRG
jgi:hypothetical protein